jgi:small subunit ribosomal protein S2
MFVIDPAKEAIAVQEANKIGIPVVAITDTNCDPDKIDFVIPGNDDAIRSIRLITARIGDAVTEGAQRRKEFAGREEQAPVGRREGPQAEIIRGSRPRRDDSADRPS